MDSKPNRIPLEVQNPLPDSHAPMPTLPSSETIEEKVQAAAQEEDLRERIIAALKTCYDPEVPVNIYEMGLIYNLDITESGQVHIKMTLTSPACPVAGSLPPEVKAKVETI